MKQLERLAAPTSASNWWKDLIAAWQPSGCPADDRGLRLAVRENYLNFYRYGQSVALIAFDRHSTPRIEIHIKYINPTVNCHPRKLKKYAQVDQSGVITWHDKKIGQYGGDNTLVEWTRNAENIALGRSNLAEPIKTARTAADREKPEVDRVARDTRDLIDLEMAWTPDIEQIKLAPNRKRKGAPRIDIVCLEKISDQYRVVLWEAKRIRDGRVRAAIDELPEVFEQLKRYANFLSSRANCEQVVGAYRNTCEALTTIYEMRSDQSCGLSGAISEIGKNTKLLTDVDAMPRVVIFGGALHDRGGWLPHQARFAEQGYTLKVFDPDVRYDLSAERCPL